MTWMKTIYSLQNDTQSEAIIREAVQKGQTLDDLSPEVITWPVLYHLSPVRENIINWYSFRPDASVLEIGAEYGAVTGILCRKAVNVTSVTASEMQAQIVRERYKQYNHLRVLAGAPDELELDEHFDYITIFGTLQPLALTNVLSHVSRFLKPQGRILLALPNRFGMKYFAGAAEDYSGLAFAGIDGCEAGLLSKGEMERQLEQCGFRNYRFYYPYPDHILPKAVFSNEALKEMYCSFSYPAYDADRYALFSENKVFQQLAREGVADRFSNSFFVEINASENEDTEEVYYAKFNNERSVPFRVGTVIYTGRGEKYVKKISQSSLTEKHLDTLNDNEKIQNTIYPTLIGTRQGNTLVYPFLQGETYGDVIRRQIQTGNAAEARQMLSDFFTRVLPVEKEQQYDSTAFTKWFGENRLPDQTVKCVSPANIDMHPDNILCCDSVGKAIDCEWITDFPVPSAFIRWRALQILLHIYQVNSADGEDESVWYTALDIDPAWVPVFQSWENHFIYTYVGANLHGECMKRKSVIHLQKQFEWDDYTAALLSEKAGNHGDLNLSLSDQAEEYITVYYAADWNSISEEHVRRWFYYSAGKKKLKIDCVLPKDTRCIRIDPCADRPCLVSNISVLINGKKAEVTTPERFFDGELIYCISSDPQIHVEVKEEAPRDIVFHAEMLVCYGPEVSEGSKLLKKQKDLTEETVQKLKTDYHDPNEKYEARPTRKIKRIVKAALRCIRDLFHSTSRKSGK